MDKKPVTRKDIAELCEVSISVVSRALNNSGYVEESKRKKIIATAERLGYVPQPVAMSLQERRTKQLLYYCKDLNNEYYLDMYRGMCQAANERGYLVTVSGVMKFERIKDTMVDGIIMPNEDTTSYYMKKGGKNYYLPVVSASFCNVADIYTSVNSGLEQGLDAEGIRDLVKSDIEAATAEVKEQQIQVLKDAGVWDK